MTKVAHRTLSAAGLGVSAKPNGKRRTGMLPVDWHTIRLYLHVLAGNGIGVFILRGLGTAMMHGGVAAVGAMLTILFSERYGWRGVRLFVPGLLAAIAIHSVFNLGFVPPVTSTVITLVALPVLLPVVFLWSETSLQEWLGNKLDQDIELLNMIATGQLHQPALRREDGGVGLVGRQLAAVDGDDGVVGLQAGAVRGTRVDDRGRAEPARCGGFSRNA